MHTILARGVLGACRLGVLALVASLALAPATAWGQLFGQAIAQPFFDYPNWARFSDCRPQALPWGYDVFPDYGPVDCACGMPPNVACEPGFVAHRPSDWYATADFAPLTLDYQDGFVIARVGPTGSLALTTNDLRPEFDAGGKFTVGRRIFDCYRVEGTYLGLYDWQDTQIVTNSDPNGLVGGIGNLSTFLSGFSNPITAGLDGNNQVAIAFQSSFQSGEVNVRYWADMPPGPFDVSYLVGARYLRINEQFNFVGQANLPLPGGTTNDAQVNTENELWGVQIGIQGCCLKTTRWWCDFDLKGGIFNNHANVVTDLHRTINGADSFTGGSTTRDRTAWVGDLSLVLNWQMTPRMVFRLGYQAIFINGLALGADNTVANADLLTTSSARMDDGGELAYHGPIIGLTWIR